MNDVIQLEREKWEAFRDRDGERVAKLYDEQALSIGYGADGSLGMRRTPELVQGLADLDLREVSLDEFQTLPVGGDGAVVTYKASFRTGRGVEITVRASSVWRRDENGWKKVFFQATQAPLT